MKTMKLTSSKYKAILLALLALTLQSANGEDEQKYLAVDLSLNKSFAFEKIEGFKPEAVADKYKLEQKGHLLQVIEAKTSEKLYELAAPPATDIDPKLDRGFEGFRGAAALPSGDLILYYYGTRKVYYSKASKVFTLLPSYLKRDGKHYLANGWNILTDELLISSCGDDGSDQYVVYELSSGKVYRVEIPTQFKEPHFLLKNLDKVQGIVEVETYEIDGEIGHDPDIIIKESLGWYKVKEKP